MGAPSFIVISMDVNEIVAQTLMAERKPETFEEFFADALIEEDEATEDGVVSDQKIAEILSKLTAKHLQTIKLVKSNDIDFVQAQLQVQGLCNVPEWAQMGRNDYAKLKELCSQYDLSVRAKKNTDGLKRPYLQNNVMAICVVWQGKDGILLTTIPLPFCTGNDQFVDNKIMEIIRESRADAQYFDQHPLYFKNQIKAYHIIAAFSSCRAAIEGIPNILPYLSCDSDEDYTWGCFIPNTEVNNMSTDQLTHIYNLISESRNQFYGR